MAINKHLTLTGTSTISWKDAITKTIEDVSKTIHNLNCVKIIEQKAKINGDKITEYFVVLDISFTIDNNIRNIQQQPDNDD